MTPDITVMLPTYNRAKELARTLDGMVRAEKKDLSIEIVIIDNGSTDQTKSIIDSFTNRLQIRYIFEARPGKSRALNTALEKDGLGKFIVFTDDDVDPSQEWFVSIASACEKWPHHSVFGGKINVLFPIENVPKWASDKLILGLAFAYHDYSNEECIYNPPYVPYGPNFWVKKNIFDTERRFSEAIGPVANNMILGEDTLFLCGLQNDGFEIVYSPKALVTHRVRPELLKLSKIYWRAYQSGRGEAHITGIPHQPFLWQNHAAWRVYRYGSIIYFSFRVLASFIFSSKVRRPPNVVKNMRGLGYRVEAIRLANQVLVQLQ